MASYVRMYIHIRFVFAFHIRTFAQTLLKMLRASASGTNLWTEHKQIRDFRVYYVTWLRAASATGDLVRCDVVRCDDGLINKNPGSFISRNKIPSQRFLNHRYE